LVGQPLTEFINYIEERSSRIYATVETKAIQFILADESRDLCAGTVPAKKTHRLQSSELIRTSSFTGFLPQCAEREGPPPQHATAHELSDRAGHSDFTTRQLGWTRLGSRSGLVKGK
jgi:hypothetical protein